MLFVAFSLVDDNFVRLSHHVRQVLRSAEPRDRKVGTVLALQHEPARKRLWRDDLEYVAMTDAVPADDDERRRLDLEAARRLEVFLDRVAWRAATRRGGSEQFLLDARYDAVVRPQEERDLRDKLTALATGLTAGERATPAWHQVEAALASLGATAEFFRSRAALGGAPIAPVPVVAAAPAIPRPRFGARLVFVSGDAAGVASRTGRGKPLAFHAADDCAGLTSAQSRTHSTRGLPVPLPREDAEGQGFVPCRLRSCWG